MLVLGIESSCDETAIALVRDGDQVVANAVASQVKQHAPYGGVIPELAAREHLRACPPVLHEALRAGGAGLADVEGVAVTCRPGLLPALLVGLSFAKGLAATRRVPLVGINHVVAHVYGAFLGQADKLAAPERYPLLALVVSGGHSSLLEVSADGRLEVVGQTIDDAAGEAFDKAAKLLHLGYPGGPLIDRLATRGDRERFPFPRGLCGGPGTPLKPEHRLQFSFSGVKTALLYKVRELLGSEQLTPDDLAGLAEEDLLDLVASYQEAVVAALATKLRWAAADRGARSLVLSGGVACNSRLRALAQETADGLGLPLEIAPPKYCTDNAAMIAGLGEHHLRHGLTDGPDLDAATRFAAPAVVPFAPRAAERLAREA